MYINVNKHDQRFLSALLLFFIPSVDENRGGHFVKYWRANWVVNVRPSFVAENPNSLNFFALNILQYIAYNLYYNLPMKES